MLIFAAGCHKENPTASAKPELTNQTNATIERTPTDSENHPSLQLHPHQEPPLLQKPIFLLCRNF